MSATCAKLNIFKTPSATVQSLTHSPHVSRVHLAVLRYGYRSKRPKNIGSSATSTLSRMHVSLRQLIEPRYIVHCGNLLAVAAMVQSDMLYLRSFMIGASVCGISFNLLQLPPLLTPAKWGIFFILGHGVQIYFLVRDNLPVHMSGELAQIYRESFEPFGFTARQFLDLCEECEYKLVSFKGGEHITTEGDDMPFIYWLFKGKMLIRNARFGDFAMFDAHTHSTVTRWTGEFFDPNRDLQAYWHPTTPHKWQATHQCLTDSCALRLDRKKLDFFLSKNDGFKAKAGRIMVKDLWHKLRNIRATTYHTATLKGMLDVAVMQRNQSQIAQDVKQGLSEYAAMNGISKEFIDDYLRTQYSMSYEALLK